MGEDVVGVGEGDETRLDDVGLGLAASQITTSDLNTNDRCSPFSEGSRGSCAVSSLGFVTRVS